MEDDAARFLKKIVKTLSVALLWLMANATTGIYFGWMIFEGSPRIGNYIYYAIMLLSLVFMIRYFYKVWKDDIAKP